MSGSELQVMPTLLDRICEALNTIQNLGESFAEGFQFLNEVQALPEDNQLGIFAEISFEVDTPQLACKYAKRFNQNQDKTVFALSYLKIQLTQFKEELQAHYIPNLNPEDALEWFSPDCDVDGLIKKCLGVGQPGDVLADLNGIKSLNIVRGVTLFKRKLAGDHTVMEKDITACFDLARKSVSEIANLQLKANLFESAGSQITLKIQNEFNSLADSMPDEQKHVIPEILSNFLSWVDTRKQAIDVTPEGESPVKRGRGRPRKFLTAENFKSK